MWGNFLYDVISCKTRQVPIDTTQTSAIVPIDEVEKVTPGTKVALVYESGAGGQAPWPAHVAWVSRGADVIWAAGVSAK